MIKMSLKEILKKLAAAKTESDINETAAIAIYNKSFIVDKFLFKWGEMRRNNAGMTQTMGRNMGMQQGMGYGAPNMGAGGYDPRRMTQDNYMHGNPTHQPQNSYENNNYGGYSQQPQQRKSLKSLLDEVRRSQQFN